MEQCTYSKKPGVLTNLKPRRGNPFIENNNDNLSPVGATYH